MSRAYASPYKTTWFNRAFILPRPPSLQVYQNAANEWRDGGEDPDDVFLPAAVFIGPGIRLLLTPGPKPAPPPPPP